MASPSATYTAPSMYNDPNYAGAQNSLMPFASSLMSGQGLPPAYSGLITPNSPQFQAMLKNSTGNILGATNDAMAAQGLSGSGVAASAAAGAVGNATQQLTWQDFLQSQTNQMNLMGMGSNIMENVGSMGLTNQSQNNSFNLTNADQSLQSQEFNSEMEMQKQQQQQAFISSLIQTGGNVASMGLLNMGGGMSGGGGNPNGIADNASVGGGVPSVDQWAAFMS